MIAAFLSSGALHLVYPKGFLALMPPFLPLPHELVFLSGVAEVVAALGLLARYRWAPIFTILVLLAVWPANWWMALEALQGGPVWFAIAAWLRLPLQVLLMWWAWRSPTRVRAPATET